MEKEKEFSEQVRKLDAYSAQSVSNQKDKVRYIVVVVIALLTLGAIVFHTLEGWSWVNSFYFATVTLTTIGYGDFVPTHEATRVFIIFYALGGVSTLLYSLTAISKYYIDKRESEFYHQVRKVYDIPTPHSIVRHKNPIHKILAKAR